MGYISPVLSSLSICQLSLLSTALRRSGLSKRAMSLTSYLLGSPLSMSFLFMFW